MTLWGQCWQELYDPSGQPEVYACPIHSCVPQHTPIHSAHSLLCGVLGTAVAPGNTNVGMTRSSPKGACGLASLYIPFCWIKKGKKKKDSPLCLSFFSNSEMNRSNKSHARSLSISRTFWGGLKASEEIQKDPQRKVIVCVEGWVCGWVSVHV